MGVPESEAFAVNDISRWVAEEPEDMGARDKLWVTADPSRTTPTHPLKAARSPEAVPEYGTDSCAERIATEIAFLMGVVTAQVELAVRHQERGVISQRIEGELRHGNELLSGLHPEYQTGRKGAVPGYDLASIRTVLNGYRGWSTELTAFDCFTGLLVFDALLGNTDRHHENWAVLQDTQTLAPSFDHGASLGFNATTTQMADPARYARKAKARHFGRNKTPIEVAQDALGMVTPDIGQLWIRQVASIQDLRIRQIVDAIPTAWMSAPRRTFVAELLEENRRRLLT